ncbi:NUMOD4 domain-containing protein [Bacillus altitudinis]|uniref:NUMOD4 domain-containing protein n=1 Tax=Bacillus altitudinis TaxID=293387 RepID=UPI00272B3042|nr:NUMOD4 domain-containing protein [Bacillus altitudinis]WLF29196.1 NUMOD4 domain-containing protein [Bacillus altitudinis]
MYAYENLSLDNMPNEQWKQFHEGKVKNYFVSDFGRIKSVDKKSDKAVIKNQILKKQREKKDGTIHERLYIQIRENNKQSTKGVSRLVAQAFIPNFNDLPVVCHNDNEPKNNHISNLRWGTYAENIQQAYDDGLFPEKEGVAVIILNRKGEMITQCDTIKEALSFLNSKDTTGFENVKSVKKNFVVMKKNYYNELNYDELLYVCRNVNSRGEIKKAS